MKIWKYVLTSILTLAAVAVIPFVVLNNTEVDAGVPSYRELTLNSSNTPTSLSDEYSSTVRTIDAYSFKFNDVKKANNYFADVKQNGFISNVSPIESMQTICVKFTGNLSFRFGNSIGLGYKAKLTSETEFAFPENYMFFKLIADENTLIESITLGISKQKSTLAYEVRIYESDFQNYTSREYVPGETVDISKWTIPEKYFEGNKLDFICWNDETLKNDITSNFVMGEKSLAFYPKYNEPTKYNWSYDPVTKQYTSIGGGYRPINLQGGKYGRYSIKVTLPAHFTGTAVGPIWNLSVEGSSYPAINSGSYMYFHNNPNVGTFQLSSVYGGSYNALKSSSNASTTYFKVKYNEWNDNGRATPLTYWMSVDFTSSSTSCYIDGERVILGDPTSSNVTGISLGLRANAAGVVVSDYEFKEYQTSSSSFNGFEVLGDSYLSRQAKTSTKIVANYETGKTNSKYSKFSCDVNIINRNYMAGGILNAANVTKSSSDIAVGDTSLNGYFLYHNFAADTNFAFTTYTNGVYASRPNGESKNIATIAYKDSQGDLYGIGSTSAAIQAYEERFTKFLAGETCSVTLNMCLEFTSSSYSFYIDNELIFTTSDTTVMSLFSDTKYDNCVNPGLVSYYPGTTFSNFKYEVKE